MSPPPLLHEREGRESKIISPLALIRPAQEDCCGAGGLAPLLPALTVWIPLEFSGQGLATRGLFNLLSIDSQLIGSFFGDASTVQPPKFGGIKSTRSSHTCTKDPLPPRMQGVRDWDAGMSKCMMGGTAG